MRPATQQEDAHVAHLQTRLPSKRRPKFSARYRSYVNKVDSRISDDDPSSDDATISHSRKRHRSSRHLNSTRRDTFNQPSDAQTTAPSSPYDADEEDEGERQTLTEGGLRKRSGKRSLPLPSAKQSRRVSGRCTARKKGPILAGEPGSLQSLGNGGRNVCGSTISTARRRLRSDHHLDCNELVTAFHAEPDFPRIVLWDHERKALVPGKVLPSHLAQVLKNNKKYAVYVGQDEKHIRYPGDVLSLTAPVSKEAWMNELRKPPARRKVMIIDPKSAKLLGPRRCPTPDELSACLEGFAKERSRDLRCRVFNAQYTEPHGFTEEHWDSMFSVPPPVPDKIAKHSARASPEHPQMLQSPSHVSSPGPSSLPPFSLPPRAMRRAKAVRYKEISSDAAKFHSSVSNRSDMEASRQLKESFSQEPRRSIAHQSFLSASGSERFDAHVDDGRHRRKQDRKIYRDIFPTSSSEHERTDVHELLSPKASSDECREAKSFPVSMSAVDQNDRHAETISPSSILVLNRTPTFELEKLYYFQDSGTSDDSLSEALDGKCLGEIQHIKVTSSKEGTQASQENLRLQIQSRSSGEAQNLPDICRAGLREGTDSPSLRFRPGRSSVNPRAQHKCDAPAEQKVPGVKSTQWPESKVKHEHSSVLNVLPRPRRRVCEVSPSLLKSDKDPSVYGVIDCKGSLDERPKQGSKQGSNEATSDKSAKNSIGKENHIGTNEKLGSKCDARNGESADDEVTGKLHASGTFTPTPAHVATVSSREAARHHHQLAPKSAAPSVIRRRRSKNPKYLRSNKDHVVDDAKTPYANELRVSPVHTGDGRVVVNHTVAHPFEEVYMWDYASKTKSDAPVPLATALEYCKENEQVMLYDGQDIQRGDQRFGEIWSDAVAWGSRKGIRPASKRKVRVWDHCTGRIEKFCLSPRMCEVEQWLKDNPDNSLYRPSLYAQYERQDPAQRAEDSELSVRSRIKRAIRNQILNRIEHLRITELCEGPQQDVILWNIVKRQCEPPRNFASRSSLTRFLLSNPALELFRGQDEVSRLEHCTELKLIHVTGKCPADFVTFWDSKLRRTCLRPKETEVHGGRTVQECIDSEPELEIYAGQDRPDTKRIRELIGITKCSLVFRRRPLSRTWYTLVKCGELLQTHVFSKGWVPKYIETGMESALHATFWSKSQKVLIMESLNDPLLSIEEYMNASSDLELYIGQDMSVHVQEQLHRWFQLLLYETGTDVNKAAPMLLRHSLVPLKYRAIRFTSRDESRIPRKLLKRHRRRGHEASEADPEDRVFKREHRTSVKRQRLSSRLNKRLNNGRNHHTSVRSFSDEEEFLLDDGRAPETETTKDHSQDTTNYEDENLDGSSGPGGTSTLSSSTLDDRCSELHSEDDSELSAEGDASVPLPGHPPDVEDHIRSAAKSVKKMICVIREAGPKVLKKELMCDIRQDLREQLILEVESVPHLLALVKDFNSHDFAATANELCEELQLLDVHGCFSCSADLGYAPHDLTSIREDLDTGRICTSQAVIKRFREVCAGLTQFHEGTLLHGQASLLKLYGEKLIARFQKSRALHIGKEQQMLRVFRICERGKRIGFRTGPRSKKSKHISNMPTLGSSELFLRVGGSQPEVTFLNYRDEKGNSVMGKRPSVRVFGFTIDTNALEYKIGNIKPCHICKADVVLSQADSMQCSNRIFGICEEVVCRECLETVFSLEQNEFKILRDSENWFCVHCRGLCPSGSECRRMFISTRTSLPARKVRLKFVWPYARRGSKSVNVVISKRHRNGEYDPLPENLPDDNFNLVEDPSGKNWVAVMDLAIGAYRCQVMVDEVWAASSTFHVLPNPADTISAYQLERPSMVSQTSVLYLRGHHSLATDPYGKLAARNRPRGPRVRWHPVSKGSAYAVHAIRDSSAQDGGTLVKTCSRTEGYDWRRAKRHATLQWVPELKPADEGHETKLGDLSRIVLCAIDSERAHLVALDNPPSPRTGISHQDFLVTLNTFRYNGMLKSLWSIVTGRSHIHGIGLFTLSGYKKGDFVIEYVGDLIRTPLADIREARYDAAGLGTYLFKINEDQIVDATVQSNRARFTNHSCDPNMVAEIVHVQGRDLIVLRATREIPRFTELTFDYKFPYEEAKVQCLCNSWNCVGVMN